MAASPTIALYSDGRSPWHLEQDRKFARLTVKKKRSHRRYFLLYIMMSNGISITLLEDEQQQQSLVNCCICLEEVSATPFRCTVCREGIICDQCMPEILEEGFGRCPVCQTPRHELNLEGHEGGPCCCCTWWRTACRCIFLIAYAQFLAMVSGCFTFFIFEAHYNHASVPVILLLGNGSLIFAYAFVIILVTVCRGEIGRL